MVSLILNSVSFFEISFSGFVGEENEKFCIWSPFVNFGAGVQRSG